MPVADTQRPLVELGQLLKRVGYDFTTVTPATHRLINARPGNEFARTLRDVFGWSRPFQPRDLPSGIFEAMCAAGACERLVGTALWRPNVRFSVLNGTLFAHSAFPTDERESVFFGPDSHRFIHALERYAPEAARVVDVGCGTGVAGILLGKRGLSAAPVVLADINPRALRFAEVNAELAGVAAQTVQSDVLRDVEGEFDLVVANPPYLRDGSGRVYRDGGGEYGEDLAVRIARESLERLGTMPRGGTLLLYTGATIVDGVDTFWRALRGQVMRPDVEYLYEELDPDVFADELEQPAYAEAERIAAVFLRARVDAPRRRDAR